MSKLNWITKACSVFVLWAAAAATLPVQTLTTLFSFDETDGGTPFAGLIQGTDGNFYGTTYFGGTSSPCLVMYGCGTVFKITPSGMLTTLYNFCAQSNCTDGEEPDAGLVQGADGSFYGTTTFGGVNSTCQYGNSCGTVFKITPGGVLTTLHSFNFTDGYLPGAGLIQSTDGNFYGTTQEGGSNGLCKNKGFDGCGTVFKITPDGVLTTLHSFYCAQFSFHCREGASPSGVLVQDADGNFYGTTEVGGVYGYGTVFRISPGGTLATLYSFDKIDGDEPVAGLVQGADGNFYGTTVVGGVHDEGTVFKITPSGMLTTLYSFCVHAGDCTDGDEPVAGLVQATDGNFYGTAEGGAYGYGEVFEITPTGALSTLYSFDGTDGIGANSGLVQGSNGSFYGTTAAGGAYDDCQFASICGTVFSLSVGLKPFVETQPTSGAVGTAVNILGSNLTGATSVTFNGTPAVFTVVSHSLITTTVPAGATTGTVEVVRPNGKGLSNVPFTVLP
jgi:uncharacterized repeat protein (TIGR03803 family)